LREQEKTRSTRKNKRGDDSLKNRRRVPRRFLRYLPPSNSVAAYLASKKSRLHASASVAQPSLRCRLR
jgi:hypothetical protein